MCSQSLVRSSPLSDSWDGRHIGNIYSREALVSGVAMAPRRDVALLVRMNSINSAL